MNYDQDTVSSLLLKEYAQENWFGDTYVKTPVRCATCMQVTGELKGSRRVLDEPLC